MLALSLFLKILVGMLASLPFSVGTLAPPLLIRILLFFAKFKFFSTV
jgi:hypothetical protein